MSEAWIDDWRGRAEGWLTEAIARTEGPETLIGAMGYTLLAGGKRLRPLLVVAGAQAVGARGDEGPVRDYAVALEMIHTYSLVHDDLPAMDDDDLRRGRPTLHKVHDEATAILAGDGLLTEAFHLLLGGDEPVRLALGRRLARAAGTAGMVGGQVMDLSREAVGGDLASVEAVHAAKTGALIEAAVAGGAAAGGGSADEVEALAAWGRAIGLAFQVVDDLLDEEGDVERLGKAVGKDQARNTATVPSVLGVGGARARAQALVDEAEACLADFGESAAVLRYLGAQVVERRR